MVIRLSIGRLLLNDTRRLANQTIVKRDLLTSQDRRLIWTRELSNRQCIYQSRSTSNINNSLFIVRNYCSKKEDQVKPEEKIKQYKEEINQIETQIKELKGQATNKDAKPIEIEIGKYDKATDDEEVIYRMAYDFPGFKSKNIRVTVVDKLLRVYAFQKQPSKKDTKDPNNTKEYIYENTTEEILPKEIDVNKMRASFDTENGFLIIEAILPEECNLKEIQKRTSELNDKLYKLEKELESKKKKLDSIKVA